MKIKRSLILLLCIFLLVSPVIIWSFYYMTDRQYQMAVLVTADENDPEYPSKRKWFDASKWLTKSQYIKVNEFYLINTKFMPIEELNDFGITLTLQKAINSKGHNLPEVDHLVDMDSQLFFQLMKDQLSYEYVYSSFDEGTLNPTIDSFLIYFPHQGKEYELLMERKIIEGGSTFSCYGEGVHLKGLWYRDFNSLLTYKQYMNQ